MQNNRIIILSIILVLVMTVISNGILLNKIEDLDSELNTITNSYHQLQSAMNSISGNVNQQLDRFTRQQSWITPIQINHEKTKVENESSLAVLTWQIKDFQPGSEVVFNYSLSESGEYQAIPARNMGNGLFEVNIPLKMKIEPTWDVHVTTRGEKSVVERVEEKIGGTDQGIRGYVSLKTSNLIKSSEINYFNFSHLAQTKYEPIRGHVDINKNQYNISLFEHQTSGNALKSVVVRFHTDSGMVISKSMEVRNHPDQVTDYSLSYDAGSQTISRIILEAKYSDGTTFEKEIY